MLETVAMLLAEMLAAGGAADGAAEGIVATVPRVFAGTPLGGGHRHRPGGAARRPPRRSTRLLADDPVGGAARLHAAVERMQRGLDELIAARLPAGGAAGDAPRARCWTPTAWSPRMPAGCAASTR